MELQRTLVLLYGIITRATAWPPRSADLTPMDYFLWGVVKSDVYRAPATTTQDMVERFQQSFQRISPLVPYLSNLPILLNI
ncbi:hypothetical protein NQ315_011013 [Exocentrus adspersus]|uniref:Secreted protein n=1 Tax=Exocentrus adspersus TaxID=1586481 RepID=A0AAV8VJC1_9CUCU|nr:hypothetical protein NQ315_011013 [Exocentrus adspersus]